MTARYELRDGVAVITLDNPPVNGLGWSTRLGVMEGIDRAHEDAAVSALVMTGAGRAFSAGADIRELGTPNSTRAPAVHDLLDAVERSDKPVVAALHGVTLGGGVELALAAHYRVASADTEIGLPEVKLGLLPGAGGTQRLPRAVGLETALNMIVSGAPARATELRATRLFDRIIPGDLLEGAIELARTAAARGGPHPRIRD